MYANSLGKGIIIRQGHQSGVLRAVGRLCSQQWGDFAAVQVSKLTIMVTLVAQMRNYGCLQRGSGVG